MSDGRCQFEIGVLFFALAITVYFTEPFPASVFAVLSIVFFGVWCIRSIIDWNGDHE